MAWAGDWPKDPGDEEILDRAYQEARVLVTLDKDFGELAIVRGLPAEQTRMCLAVLAKYRTALDDGAIVTVETARVRVRPPSDNAVDRPG